MGKSWTGIGLGLGGAPLLRRGPHISTAAKLLLDLVPDADLLYMPSLQLSRKITNSVELRRTSDQAEQEFTPKQWQDSDVVAFADGGDARATKVFDWSGKGNHGTQTTAAAQPFAVTGGVLEEGLRFAGAQWIDTGSTSVGNGLFAASDKAWTVSVWAKVTGDGCIVGKSGSSVSNAQFQIRATVAGDLSFWNRGSSTTPSPAIKITDSTYRLITFVWNGAEARFWINNQLNTQVLGTGQIDDNGFRIAIGTRSFETSSGAITGNIAFAGIWPRALTPTEIETVYNLTDPR